METMADIVGLFTNTGQILNNRKMGTLNKP